MNTFVKTLDLVIALKAAIAALQLPNTYSAIEGYPAAFQVVEVYRSQNLVKALEDMIIQDDRVCFIIPGGDTHDHEKLGNVLQVKRDTEIHLLFADRNYGKENLALVGEANVSPGVMVLKDILVDGLVGAQLNFNNVVLAPTSGEPFHLTDREREDVTGRDCWAQSFTTYAGAARIGIR